MQRAVWHSAGQRGVCRLQEWPGVDGLQGKERPSDGGESVIQTMPTYYWTHEEVTELFVFLGVNKNQVKMKMSVLWD